MNKEKTAGKNNIRSKASDEKGVVLHMNNRINNNSRKRAVKRERIIMLVSSAFVMAALTMTGMYMKEKNEQEKSDGYKVDLAQLDTNINEKYEGFAKDADLAPQLPQATEQEKTEVAEGEHLEMPKEDVELDYMPREDSVIGLDPITAVGSGQVELPQVALEETEVLESVVDSPVPDFSESEGLILPVPGEIIMHYNMDNTVYFQTLDQFKYNPAVIFAAPQGSEVLACADGQVTKIYQNEEIGVALVLDLGNGYEVTYGQLATYNTELGDYVTEGQIIGTVAGPTKYYVTEGNNLYFAMKKNGTAINPEGMFR